MSNETPGAPAEILMIEDDGDVVRAARLLLVRAGHRLIHAPDPAAAWVTLADARPDIILLDLNFSRGHVSGVEGLNLLDRLIAADPGAVIVVITGHSGVAIAVDAMRRGASDFIIKPWKNERLLRVVEQAVQRARRPRPVAVMPDRPADTALPYLLGEHPAMVQARAMIARIAPSVASVLICGPPGSGKTLAAHCLHHASGAAAQPLIRIEGEGFDPDFLADRGSGAVLIENVDRIPAERQHDAARVLAERRVLATTCQTLEKLRSVISGDLFHRVGTIPIALPPLADRGADVMLLARHFLALSAMRHDRAALVPTPEGAALIAGHAWPDNVRGLEQAMERATLLTEGDSYDAHDLAVADGVREADPGLGPGDLNLERNEARLVEAALKRHSYNISRAATDLGLTRAALYRRMDKHGL